jgi:predicted DNA-binding transcriptional regulator YafY
VQRGAVTYLVATLYDYTDIRMLAVHRIMSAQVLDIPAKTPKKFDLSKYISEGAFGFDERGEIELVVRFTEPAVEHLRETPLSLDQKIEPEKADWVCLHATVPDTAQLRWWLMGFGDQVEVLEPTSLRDEFSALSKSMNKIYHP